jgi:hypothetical protein
MTPFYSRFFAVAGGLVVAGSLMTGPAEAQTAPVERRQAAPPTTSLRVDANATRQELMELLEKHPPAVGRVLKLDPSLMRSEAYLAAYPELRDFFAQHPEIPQNAPYYLEGVRVGNDDFRPRNDRVELAAAILAGLAAFTAAAIVLSTVIWVIRTTLEQRRWSRLSKIQAEVHSKLMDRFSSNDELMTYVQTPSGRRFLESGPSPLQETTPAMGAPISRILWSLQLGAVLLVGGLGMLFVSNSVSTGMIPEAAEFFYIAGCIAMALGAGFLVSAVAAYALSSKLGLLARSTPHSAAQDNA